MLHGYNDTKLFLNIPILPVTNINILTATNKWERTTSICNNFELECPIFIMNKLIYDGIIGIGLLNILNARIDAINNKIEYNYKGIQHNITLN